MTIAILGVVTAVLALLFVTACAVARRARTNHAQYRKTHPYTEADQRAARAQSLRRSRSIVSGQVIEQLAPFFPDWPAEHERAPAARSH